MKKYRSIPCIALAALLSLSAYNPASQVYVDEPGAPDESLTLKQVYTASDNVITLLFESDVVNLEGIDISDPSAWKVNRKPALALNKFVTEAEGSEHHIYITTDKLKPGKRYVVKTPYGRADRKSVV